MPWKALFPSMVPAVLIAIAALSGAPDVHAGQDAPSATSPASTRRALAALWRRTDTLATLEQRPRQSEQDFLLEVAAAIEAFTVALQVEVCGVFERRDNPTRLVLTLLTQGSPAFCLHPRGRPEAGGGLEGASIHSHVDARARPRMPRGDVDAVHGGQGDAPGQPLRFAGARFTLADLAGGPGYLVHRGRLWHQRGLGTQRFVARVEAPRPAVVQQYLATATEPSSTPAQRRDGWRDDGWSITDDGS